jgi:type 2 lantibiotic biosynthesis protein LanM
MRDGADRSIQLDILSRGLLSSEIKPPSWPLLGAEKQALEQLDIPHFTAYTDEDFLKISAFNNQILEKYFVQPSYNLILERLKSLDYFDLEKQTHLIRDSLNTFSDTNVHSFSLKEDLNTAPDPDLSPLSQQDALQQATTLARYLKKESIASVHENKVTWLTRQYIPEEKKCALISLDNSLYYGSCGITLFLAALENVTGDVEFRDLIMAALRPLHLHLKESASKEIARKLGIGGGVGLGSTLYGLVQTSKLSGEAGLLEDAQKIALLITPALITSDKNFDIISGAAGAILALLALYNHVNDSEVLEQAIICGHHLLNNRCVSETGHRSWVTFDGKLLTGFSHGAAGIAYALLRLYQASGEVAFLEAAKEAITYERSVFIPEEGNWPDFRESSFEKRPICQCSWCHGAPGIGLARVAGLDILDTNEIRQDIEAAINTTKCHQLMDVDHLCCGNLGRVEFLFTAARKLCESQLRDIAMVQAAQIVKRAEQMGTFGYPLSLGCNPGFFLGAAGIGYELLRLAYPDQLPSVLLWE